MDSSELLTTDGAISQAETFLSGGPARPLVVILGPTASGKTAFSIRLAKALLEKGIAAEVISGDSRQFYRGLDIGTAKITEEEMQGVPHHLLSVLDPDEPCSISWFQAEASKVIDALHARRAVPLLVGGSMLYLSALIDGFRPLSSDPALRTKIEAEYERDEGASLMKELTDADPETALSFPVQNKVYVVRAVEILRMTGEPPSKAKTKSESPYDLLIFGLRREGSELRDLIRTRAEAMLASGWIEEVERLKAQGYNAEDPAMKSHGYREIFSALESGIIDKEALLQVIVQKTAQYAKRSVTWWKRDPRIRWIHAGS